jgi:hypothetical protein
MAHKQAALTVVTSIACGPTVEYSLLLTVLVAVKRSVLVSGVACESTQALLPQSSGLYTVLCSQYLIQCKHLHNMRASRRTGCRSRFQTQRLIELI